jgi:hypothetical protein
MPLKDLPAYLDSVRERGQGDYVPVVEMGMIVDDRPGRWARALAYSSVACLFVAMGAVGVAVTKTRSITVAADGMGPQAVADIISDEGGRVFSVSQNEDGEYEVRVFTFQRMSYFLERLRGNKEFGSVDIAP